MVNLPLSAVPAAPAHDRARTLGKASGDILKAILALQAASASDGVALPSDIASRTGTSRAFVTKMLRTLTRQGLIEYAAVPGARLTQDGQKNAVELSRHHRLLERFLTDYLGYDADGAHREAERLEHVISEEFEARLDQFMDFPTACPHGSPIPRPDGSFPVLEEK